VGCILSSVALRHTSHISGNATSEKRKFTARERIFFLTIKMVESVLYLERKELGLREHSSLHSSGR
jgi:hypothetical protein